MSGIKRTNDRNSLKGVRIIKRLIFVLISISILLTGCSAIKYDLEKEYDGSSLKIGVIGSVPEVRETEIVFEEIGFDFLKEDFSSKYNAIFITKENLSEASKAEYASIYKNSKIPFYFIENEKPHVCFIDEDLSYEGAPDSKGGMYITGLLCKDDKYKTWGYGLYNDTKSERNIKCVYSRIFKDISKIKSGELKF